MAGRAKDTVEEVALRRFNSSLISLHGKALGTCFLGVVCPASAVSSARLLAAHCCHTHAEVPRQCEVEMSEKSVPHHEETGELETQKPASYRLYI